MSMLRIKPKGWGHFQHYKNRRPPWIKLHRTIIDDFDYQCLQLASKALAPCLWLIASEHEEGLIEVDFPKLSWRLRTPEPLVQEAIKELIDKGFFVIASGVLAECLHHAIPEKERETEGEAETEGEIATLSSAKRLQVPVQEVIELYNSVCVPFGRPAVQVVNKKRIAGIKRIWNQSKHAQSLDWWQAYFESAMTIPFMANGFTKADGSVWGGADLDYLLQDKTVARVVERSQ